MGMYDSVNYECECPECGASCYDFQSKDGPCKLITLEVWEVDNLYDFCSGKDRHWVEFNVVYKNNGTYKLIDVSSGE